MSVENVNAISSGQFLFKCNENPCFYQWNI
jgi:hypothetical protein